MPGIGWRRGRLALPHRARLENSATAGAWNVLRPYLARARGFVFSRREYVPSWIPADKVAIIPPSIDPFSPKNQYLDEPTVEAILGRIGVFDGGARREPVTYRDRDGHEVSVTRPAEVTAEVLPGPGDQLVVQVSGGTSSRTCQA